MFSNFISLGSACLTASSMSKYGLRSWSGPFDWLVTDSLQWVLHYMENEFKDFLLKDNLERMAEYPKAFRDKTSGFVFHHDYEYPFEYKYDELKQRYQKRIDRFIDAVEKPTCFLRSVIRPEEIEYITGEGYQYINDVIRKKNSKNEIIFLVRKDVELTKPIQFRHYIMPGAYTGGIGKVIRNWFDDSDEFQEYCFRNYDVTELMKNVAFDRKHIETEYQTVQLRYWTLLKLIDFDSMNVKLPKEIIIYGAGNIGQFFYGKIKAKCKVKCFVDKQSYGSSIDGIPIIRLDEVDDLGRTAFVITAVYDYENICTKIKKYNEKAEIILLDELLK